MNYELIKKDKLVSFKIKDKRIEGGISAKYKAEFLIFCQPELDAFIIDLSEVESIDSAGFGAFLLAYRQLKEHGIPVVMVSVDEYVKSLMEMTQIDQLFEFADSQEEAMSEFDSSIRSN